MKIIGSSAASLLPGANIEMFPDFHATYLSHKHNSSILIPIIL
jgi:hypothetical protein